MPAEVTWQLIGLSFIPLALGVGMLFLALRLVERRWLQVSILLMALPLLACWLLIVFTAAYPTIDQTDEGPGPCYDLEGIEVECPPRFEQIRGD